MKKIVTVLCSLAFMFSGMYIARSTAHIETATQSLNAATLSSSIYPTGISSADLPLDLRLDLVKHDTVFVRDTIYPAFLSQDVVIKGRSKKRSTRPQRHKRSIEPDTMCIIQKDTLYVPSVFVVVPLEELDSTKSVVKTALKK